MIKGPNNEILGAMRLSGRSAFIAGCCGGLDVLLSWCQVAVSLILKLACGCGGHSKAPSYPGCLRKLGSIHQRATSYVPAVLRLFLHFKIW